MGFTASESKQHKRINVIRRKSGDAQEREFERLYRESYGLVYNYVRYRMTDSVAAEDIVAEAYCKAARAFSRYDASRSKFSTWVTNIAINCMRSYYRKAKPTTNLDDIPESEISISDQQQAVDDRDFVIQLLNVLDADERELVLMKYREDMRNVEIAKALGMNASTVSTRLARALAKMRDAAERSA